VVVTAAEVEQLRGRPDVQVIDARDTRFYLGQDTNHVRPGHIPGARNLVFSTVTGEEPYRFRSRDSLTRMFAAAGAGPGKRIIAYCHIGQQATAVWFAARLLGYDARLYDGSFTEWTELTQYPVDQPMAYLKTAVPRGGTDTLDTFLSPRDAAPGRPDGPFVVRALRQVGRRRYELTDTWYDSTGRVTARQTARTADGSLATEVERVRAETDSATIAVAGGRATGWVVPQGQPPRLLDGAAPLERFSPPLVGGAIVAARPAVGTVFLAPYGSVYGESPLETLMDTIRVVARETLRRGDTAIPALVVERGNGTRVWLDEQTGHELASRGTAGPTQWWWHIRRGVTPPAVP
jgi:rhodanese-related sulfurtransferase